MEDVVIVEDLVVAYGTVTAVDRVSLQVRRGEHVTLLGPSGCGKTTTLRAIAGLEHPVAGRIIVGGRTVFDGKERLNVPPERRGLSMVFQSYAIWPHMTVFDNVAFGLTVRGAAKEIKRDAVMRSLALVDLADFAERPATALSGGQQQRVALARAIAFDSKVVLLDEPLSNLDARLRATMRTELKELQKRLGFTSIYVTHDQEEALALSDRIIIMRDGVIEQEGRPGEVHRAPRTRFVAEFMGATNILECIVNADPERAGAGIADVGQGIRLRTRQDGNTAEGRGWISFRPMNVKLAGQPGGDGLDWHAGTVRRCVFLGDLTHTHIRSGELEICTHGPSEAAFPEGTAVWWSVDADDAYLLYR